MTNESYKLAKQQQCIITRVQLGVATSTALVGKDGNRVRIRFSALMIDDFATTNDFAAINTLVNGLPVCVGVITSGNPSVELSLEEHGDIIYEAFVGLNPGLNTNIIGIVQTRIIGKVD